MPGIAKTQASAPRQETRLNKLFEMNSGPVFYHLAISFGEDL